MEATTQLPFGMEGGVVRGARPGLGRTLAAGLAGAITVTLLNEVGRRKLRGAPRIDRLGVRGVKKLAHRVGRSPTTSEAYWMALAGDVLSNTAYYALAGAFPRHPRRAGLALGALAGTGAVALPHRMGLGRWPTRRRQRTKALSFGWYLAAGIVAGAVLARAASSATEAR